MSGLVAAVAAAWWMTGHGATPTGIDVDVGPPVDDAISLPTTAATPEGQDVGVPVEILATCQAEGRGDTGCVRWARRAGQLPRAGAGALVTVVGGDRVEALDAQSGARRWTAAVTPPAQPPLALGDDTVLVEDGAGVRALAAIDGDERWRHDGVRLPLTAPDHLEQDVVVLQHVAGTLQGVTVADGTLRWSRPFGEDALLPPFVAPLGADRAVVGVLDRVRVVDLATGTTVWAAGRRTDAESPLAISVGHVATVHEDGAGPEVRIRDRGGHVTGVVPLDPEVRLRQVGVTEALLLLRTRDALVAHRLDDGSEAWRRDDLTGALVTARPIPLSSFAGLTATTTGLATVATRSLAVVALRSDGTATVLDARTGEDVRVVGDPASGVRVNSGFLTPGRLWLGDARSLEVYDLPTGDRLLHVEVRAPPSVVRTDPLVIETSGRLVRIDLDGAAASTSGQL